MNISLKNKYHQAPTSIIWLVFVIHLLKSVFSCQAGRGILPCLTMGMFAWRSAAVSENVCCLSTSRTDPVALIQPHPGWNVLLGEVPFASAPYCITVAKRLLYQIWPMATSSSCQRDSCPLVGVRPTPPWHQMCQRLLTPQPFPFPFRQAPGSYWHQFSVLPQHGLCW